MALVLTPTRLGNMYVLPACPVTLQFTTGAPTQVFYVDRNTETAAAALITGNEIYKYFATDASLPTAELSIRMQVSTDGATWSTIRTASRYIGKDTVDLINLEGSFMFGQYRTERYFRVMAKLVGTPVPPAITDTLSSIKLTVGLSFDSYKATSPGKI